MRKKAELAVLFGLIFSILLSMAHFDAACEDLRSNVLRLHILANSDSSADQAVKLKVRDALLAESLDIFADCEGLNCAEQTATEQTETFQKIADQTLAENGFTYRATVGIETCYFETREYDDFTLPAGYYRSLVVRLGEGSGKNWWCVIFPAVCVPTASKARLNDSVSAYSSRAAEHPEHYKMRFWVVEIIERLKRK